MVDVTRGSKLTPSEKKALENRVTNIRASLPRRVRSEAIDQGLTASPVQGKRQRGRPVVGDSNNQATEDSFEAFLFVQSELMAFRKTIGRKRLPDEVMERFIVLALEIAPEASPNIIREYIRRNNTLDIVDELKSRNPRS